MGERENLGLLLFMIFNMNSLFSLAGFCTSRRFAMTVVWCLDLNNPGGMIYSSSISHKIYKIYIYSCRSLQFNYRQFIPPLKDIDIFWYTLTTKFYVYLDLGFYMFGFWPVIICIYFLAGFLSYSFSFNNFPSFRKQYNRTAGVKELISILLINDFSSNSVLFFLVYIDRSVFALPFYTYLSAFPQMSRSDLFSGNNMLIKHRNVAKLTIQTL